MKMKKLLACLLTFAMIFSLVVGCAVNTTYASDSGATSGSNNDSSQSGNNDSGSSTGFTGDPIYLAFIAPITGSNSQYGQAYVNASTIRVEEINAAGGINGRELIIDYYDDKNDPNEALLMAKKVVAENKYSACLGSQSSACSMVIAPILQEAGIVELSPQTSHNDFTDVGDYIFRMLITSKYEGPVYTDYIMKTWPDTRKPGILYFETDFGKGLTQFMTERFEEYGLELLQESFIADTTKDFTPMLSKLMAEGCDLFIPIGNYNDVAQILIQAEQLGFDVPMFADGMIVNEAFANVAGTCGEGLHVLDIIDMKGSQEPFASFKKTYEERFGVGVDMYACSAYDAVSLIALAIEKYGPDSAKIRDFLTYEVKGIEGITGKITFEENRVRNVNFVVLEYTDGEFKNIGDYMPDLTYVPTKVQ